MTPTIDGIAPGKILYPTSTEDLSEMIRSERGSIVPMGAGSQLCFGNPLRSADCVVDLTRLNRITTYNPAELTIHVEAGVTLGEIHRVLEENNQALPLDPWNGPGATIGGIAAANSQGPLRATGTIRDWIIGMKVVHADGRISKTGGRVVKNVTGYDLAKLYTGSLGSLAVSTEISFKVCPRFGRTATAIAQFQNVTEVEKTLLHVRKSALQPVCCELAGPEHALWLRFEEHPKAVEWQLSQLPPGDWKIVEGDEETVVWEKFRKHSAAMGPIVLRVVGLPAQVIQVIEEHHPSSWTAHALNGIVLMEFPDVGSIAAIRERFPAVIEKAPIEIRKQIGTFGVSGTPKRLMQDLKRAFDPEGRLNPGRHIDGE